MQKNNKIYLCRPWNYTGKKDDKILLIWPDIPTWVVVDDELFLLLKTFNGKNTISDIIDTLSNQLNQSVDTTRSQLDRVIPILIKEKIFYEKGRKLPESDWCDTSKIRGVLVHSTNKCNLNCIMCCNKNNPAQKEHEIGINEIKQFLDEVLEFTIDEPSLSILGGEPLVVADKTLEIAKYAREKGFKTIYIISNGTLINREIAKKAKKLNLQFQVSMDGVTEEENDRIRGRGSFKKIIRGIKILKEEGVHVETSFTCQEGNYRSLEKYYKMALKLGVNYATFGHVRRIGAGLNKEIKTIPVDKLFRCAYKVFKDNPECKKLFGKDYFSVFANQCRLKMKNNYCGTGLITVLLNTDGCIYPCTGLALSEFNAGDIRNEPFSAIWKNSPILKKIRETYPIDTLNEKCSNCIVRYWCLGGCRAEAFHFTHKMRSPAVTCEELKKAVIEMMWTLSITPEMGEGKIYHF